jgi:hypothetical protein
MISGELNRNLDDTVTVEDFGRVRRVVVTKEECALIEGGGTEESVEGRTQMIRGQLNNATSDWDKEKLEERIGRLSGSVAIIKVGAATEVELTEKKHRVEDALEAVTSARLEGVVPGGGVALVRTSTDLEVEVENDTSLLLFALNCTLLRLTADEEEEELQNRLFQGLMSQFVSSLTNMNSNINEYMLRLEHELLSLSSICISDSDSDSDDNDSEQMPLQLIEIILHFLIEPSAMKLWFFYYVVKEDEQQIFDMMHREWSNKFKYWRAVSFSYK